MLVPVQYQRLMALPDFDAFDLSSTRYKFCTSAPFGAELKAEVLRRWQGGLVEFYGMTEGGGSCVLEAHLHPDKLHTVGRPAPGHELRLVDAEGRELPGGDPAAVGEVVGHSAGMMRGYHKRPEATREAEWFDATGKRFIRTGDIGRFDADGFLTLLDRRKDLIISGGFNIYPSDLEATLREHPAVADAAVVGVPSQRWGETPAGFVVRREGDATGEDELLQWANARLGKTQRLQSLHFIDELPRSAIGKVLKRELRERHQAA
jgi:acyl-CoA synthetase (AMP-forming)/AMP-acid ligase II